jgi:hypothetical protein
MSTSAVAAEMSLLVIGGGAATQGVIFSSVSACLQLCAQYSNVALNPALVVLCHVALTVNDFVVFWLMVMYKPIRK